MTTDELNKKIEELTFFITTEQEKKVRVLLNELYEIFESAFIVFSKCIQQIADNITQIIEDIVENLIQLYPNPKIVNLALHHPRAKVRKKNKRRIFKWLHKWIVYEFSGIGA